MPRRPAEREGTGRARRWRRRLAAPLLALVVLELLYLLVGNSFLRSEWGQRLANRRPEKFTATWETGWTWLPGLVRVDGLEIGGAARRARWSARMDRARLLAWPPSLVNRHLRLFWGRADGARIDVQTLPPPAGPRPQPKRKRGWRFTLGRLHLAPLDELRINEYALRGEGRLDGWARFQVRGPMEFDLDRFAFDEAVLASGEQIAAEPLVVDATIQIEPVTIGDTTVEDLLSGMTGVVRIDSESAGIGFLGRYLEKFSWLRLGGRGRLHVDVEITDGWMAPGSVVALDGPVLEAEFVGLAARGEGRLRGGVPQDASHAELRVDLDRFSVSRLGETARMAAGEGLVMTIRNDSSAIDRPAEGIDLELVLPPTDVPELAAFNPYLPPSTGLTLTGGQAQIAAEVDYSSLANSGSGWLRLAGERIEATFRDLELRSEVSLDARFAEVQLADGTADLSGSRLEIRGVEVSRDERLRDSAWWGTVALPSGRVTKPLGGAGEGPATVEGSIEAELRDTGPIVALLEERMPKLSWIDGLLTVENVDAASRLRIRGKSFRLEDLTMTGGANGNLELLAEVDLEERTPEGVIFARWRKLSAAVALEEGERDWKLINSRDWYEESAVVYRGDRDEPADGAPEEGAPATAPRAAETDRTEGGDSIDSIGR